LFLYPDGLVSGLTAIILLICDASLRPSYNGDCHSSEWDQEFNWGDLTHEEWDLKALPYVIAWFEKAREAIAGY